MIRFPICLPTAVTRCTYGRHPRDLSTSEYVSWTCRQIKKTPSFRIVVPSTESRRVQHMWDYMIQFFDYFSLEKENTHAGDEQRGDLLTPYNHIGLSRASPAHSTDLSARIDIRKSLVFLYGGRALPVFFPFLRNFKLASSSSEK